jgi:hypothetical protein
VGDVRHPDRDRDGRGDRLGRGRVPVDHEHDGGDDHGDDQHRDRDDGERLSRTAGVVRALDGVRHRASPIVNVYSVVEVAPFGTSVRNAGSAVAASSDARNCSCWRRMPATSSARTLA